MNSIHDFIASIDKRDIVFADLMQLIGEHYDYTPTLFTNGIGDDCVINKAGTNEGSCKLFAFAKLHELDKTQTLLCFGEYYRDDVLKNPEGNDHANIRTFMKYGWEGIQFSCDALVAK